MFSLVCDSVRVGVWHTPLRADTHPQADTPQVDTPPADGHCSGRYSSYWNAFLLFIMYLFMTLNGHLLSH